MTLAAEAIVQTMPNNSASCCSRASHRPGAGVVMGETAVVSQEHHDGDTRFHRLVFPRVTLARGRHRSPGRLSPWPPQCTSAASSRHASSELANALNRALSHPSSPMWRICDSTRSRFRSSTERSTGSPALSPPADNSASTASAVEAPKGPWALKDDTHVNDQATMPATDGFG